MIAPLLLLACVPPKPEDTASADTADTAVDRDTADTGDTADTADTGEGPDTAPPEGGLALVLYELALEVSIDLYEGVHAALGADTMDAMAEGETLSGTFLLPADADPEHWRTDGEVDVVWEVTRREDGFMTVWDWTLTIEIASLTLPSATVSGTAEWTPSFVQFESMYINHAWSGPLSVDGAEPVDVAFTSVSTWSKMNLMSGTIADEAVDYENPHPDWP